MTQASSPLDPTLAKARVAVTPPSDPTMSHLPMETTIAKTPKTPTMTSDMSDIGPSTNHTFQEACNQRNSERPRAIYKETYMQMQEIIRAASIPIFRLGVSM